MSTRQRAVTWINTAGVLALILLSYLAFETSSPLFKYLLQFLITLRPLTGLNKSISTEKKKKRNRVKAGPKNIICGLDQAVPEAHILILFSNKHQEIPFLLK